MTLLDVAVHNEPGSLDAVVDEHEATALLAITTDLDLVSARELGFDHVRSRPREGAGCHLPQGFFASSACVYAADKQTSPDFIPLKEGNAYPAMPDDGYGWRVDGPSLPARSTA